MRAISPHRPSTRLRRALAALAAGLALLLAGCGGSAGSDGAASGELTPVTFLNVLPIESLTFTPEIVAQAGGYFEREGLDVQFQVTRGSAQAIQTVIAGSALVTRVGDTEMMVAVGGRDAPVRAFGQPSQQSTLRIVSAADDPIRAPEDLRGKKIGIPSEGGTSETLVDTLAATAGLADTDLDKQVVGLAPGVYELVQQGRIDGYVVAMDTAVALERDQPDAVVLDPSQVISGGTQVYLTSAQALEDPAQRDVLSRFLRAVKAAQESVIADQSLDTTLQTLGDAYDIPILREPEVAKETLRTYIASWQAGGEGLLKISPSAWSRIYDESVAVHLVPGGLDASAWYTNDLLGASS
ncbi:MAG TPA: ABC transporter substrate-binding protein [Pseudonocardia sp.]|jgi:NitT/TauT family transport system substrate-binding protein|uniref:ABC transporter substrate-binding protein n=1 Tax=Pseudonocardia sp. TaxID=60912 RepID=UPI002B4B94C3|nr:ABC transporter substrate-binding protein [Pseudonocardia sp.]HLU54505.1 ABC transporter substrate-binding protein [Pseudonocardia sp.]